MSFFSREKKGKDVDLFQIKVNQTCIRGLRTLSVRFPRCLVLSISPESTGPGRGREFVTRPLLFSSWDKPRVQ